MSIIHCFIFQPAAPSWSTRKACSLKMIECSFFSFIWSFPSIFIGNVLTTCYPPPRCAQACRCWRRGWGWCGGPAPKTPHPQQSPERMAMMMMMRTWLMMISWWGGGLGTWRGRGAGADELFRIVSKAIPLTFDWTHMAEPFWFNNDKIVETILFFYREVMTWSYGD